MSSYIGTSGYSYNEWKGKFYPDKIRNTEMLAFYSKQFNTVEINNTFYRMPKSNVLLSWRKQVPKNFKFIIKAPRRITHINKLEPDDSLKYFTGTASSLNKNLGALLFQLPPYFKKDIDKLKLFITALPSEIKTALEFRNNSWFDDEVYECLGEHNLALCLTDTDEEPVSEMISTADWGYLRLRKSVYNAASLKKISAMIKKTKWKESFVLFKHEDEAAGPKYAAKFNKILQT